jgi:hypothetical protein
VLGGTQHIKLMPMPTIYFAEMSATPKYNIIHTTIHTKRSYAIHRLTKLYRTFIYQYAWVILNCCCAKKQVCTLEKNEKVLVQFIT